MAWKMDLALVGGGMALGGLAGGAIAGVRRLNKHVTDNTPDAPADYVTLLDYNRQFHTLKRFVKTVNEKSFLKTLRHRLSRLIKLAYNEDARFKDSTYWSRLGAIHMRQTEVQKLLDTVQFLVKKRHGDKPMVGFDDAIQEIRAAADDIRHNNILQGTDID